MGLGLGTAEVPKIYAETGGRGDEATLSQECGLSSRIQGSHRTVKISLPEGTRMYGLDQRPLWVCTSASQTEAVLLFFLLSQETGQGKLKEEGSCFDWWFERT